MCFQRSLIPFAMTIVWLTSINGVDAQDAFWYPQPVQPSYPIYESVPYGGHAVPHYPHCPSVVVPHHSGVPQVGAIVTQEFGSFEIIQSSPSTIVPHTQIIEPAVEMSIPEIAPPIPVIEIETEESSDDNVESPSDMSIEELEKQSRSNSGQRFLEIEGQIEGLRDTVAESNAKVNSRLNSLAESLERSQVQNREQMMQLQKEVNELVDRGVNENGKRVEKLLNSSEKEKRKLVEQLKAQADQIERLNRQLREMDEQLRAQKKSMSSKKIERLQAELEKAIESVEAERRRGNRNARPDLDRIMEQMSRVIEKEIKDSINDQRERIIRNLIREANRELQDKKKRKKKSDDDRCEEDD